MTTIYSLTDPRTGVVRYVGKTVASLEVRLRQHIWAARKGSTHRDHWLRSLEAEGMRPSIQELEVIASGDWQERERHWIARFRDELGDMLTNISAGGDGVHGVPRTAAWTQKIAAAQRGKQRRPLSAEHRAAIGASSKGRSSPKSPEHREKIRKARLGQPGISPSAETRAKLRAAHLGKRKPPLTPEQRERYLAATPRGTSHPQARLTEEAVRAIRGAATGGRGLATQFAVSYGTVKAIRSGRLWAHVT